MRRRFERRSLSRHFPCAVLAGLLTAGALSALVPAESTVVTGHLLGHDGKPMVKAHVHLTRPPGRTLLTAVEVSPSGKFRLTTREAGALLLQFSGVSHRQKDVPLIIQKPTRIDLDVRLKTYEYVEDLGGVKVALSDDFKSHKAVEMARQLDGTYSLEVETSSPKVSYELVGIEKSGRSINGTHSDAFEYDGSGDYQSVLRARGGKVTIRFDPKRLVRSPAPATARFANPNSVEAGFLSIFEDSEAREEAYLQAVERHREEGKSGESPHMDWSAQESALSRRLQGEKDPLLQEALRLSLLNLAYCGGSLSPESIRQTVADVSPRSPLWSYYPFLIAVVVQYTPGSDSPDSLAPGGAPSATSDSVEQIVAGRPEQEVKSLMLFLAGFKARSLRQSDRANRYYQRLASEFPNSSEARAAFGLGPESKIRVGKAIPSFSFPALDDPNTAYTPGTLQGKIYLLDFWATWCGPCVGEQGALHKAYEKYKDQGFEIISLSFDGRPEDVVRFRKEKWRMPWLHTFVTGGFGSETANTFEVGVIPKPILVDRRGMIIATYEELSGSALDATLDRALGQKK